MQIYSFCCALSVCGVLCPPCAYIGLFVLLCFECYIYRMKVIYELVSVFVPGDGEKVCYYFVALVCSYMYVLYIYICSLMGK